MTAQTANAGPVPAHSAIPVLGMHRARHVGAGSRVVVARRNPARTCCRRTRAMSTAIGSRAAWSSSTTASLMPAIPRGRSIRLAMALAGTVRRRRIPRQAVATLDREYGDARLIVLRTRVAPCCASSGATPCRRGDSKPEWWRSCGRARTWRHPWCGVMRPALNPSLGCMSPMASKRSVDRRGCQQHDLRAACR